MENLEHGWIATKDKNCEYEEKYICGWCGESIYECDEYYDFDGEKVCCDCVKDCKKYA